MIISCSQCGKQYKVPEEKLGIKFRCAGCKHVVDTNLPDIPTVDDIEPQPQPEAADKKHVLISPKGNIFLPSDKEFIFGRGLQSDYLLEDSRSSRRHARLFWNGAAFLLSDLDSRNGTRYQGREIDSTVPLRDGDRFEIASETFLYRTITDDAELHEHTRTSQRMKRMSDTEELPSMANAAPANDFNGSLDSMSATELCQVLHLGQRTGRLLILDDNSEKCTFYFQDGQILHAQFSGERGEEAVFKGLGIKHGIFSFQCDIKCNKPNVAQKAEFLLLEAARRGDER